MSQPENMTNAELDRLAAVEVMGWRFEGVYVLDMSEDGKRAKIEHPRDWNPTTDLNDAWRLVKTFELVDCVSFSGICVEIHFNDDRESELVLADHPARALTIVAIKASRNIKQQETNNAKR